MSDLDQAIRQFRRLRAQRERSTALQLRNAYLTARNSLGAQLDNMTAWMESERAAGREVPLWRVLAEARTRNLLFQAEAAFTRYSREVGETIQHEQRQAVAQAQTDARELIEASMGPTIGMPFVRLPQGAISELVATLQPGAPVRELLNSFGPSVAKIIEDELTSGLAMGRNPRATARTIMERIDPQPDLTAEWTKGIMGRTRTIIRTETLRAYRGSTLAVYQENADLLRGWQWHAARSSRTCPVCLALDGRVFRLNEPFRSHVNCRCSAIPLVRGSTMQQGETAAEWFDNQPAETQQRILGPEAYEVFANGDVELADFVRVHQSQTWGSSYVRGSIDTARERARARERRAA